MRRFRFIAMAALLASMPARAQQTQSATPSSADGWACFENLTTPEYPKDALQGHMDGSVWSWTNVNAQGGVDKVETQVVSAWSQGEKLLPPSVEKAIRAAKIKPDCWGKKVSVVFRYQLHGEAIANPKVTSRNEGSNIMDIESQPATTTQAAANLHRSGKWRFRGPHRWRSA
jgi:hypothetical protein